MGWGNCGTDSKGRPIGYVFPARCDHPGCKAKIDRGLAYACGDMHGADEYSCERYFCSEHKRYPRTETDLRGTVCFECATIIEAEEAALPASAIEGGTEP